jgi:hypothetical protein
MTLNQIDPSFILLKPITHYFYLTDVYPLGIKSYTAQLKQLYASRFTNETSEQEQQFKFRK